MLEHLTIRNVILVDECILSFTRGLNVLTGETGAGKSILLDALGLVLGERGDAKLVRAGETQASVSAEFNITHNHAAQSLLETLGLEPSDQLIIRRVLGSDGKGRSFINDASVSVTALKQLGDALIERHGQHDQRGLLDAGTHLFILDAFAGLDPKRKSLEEAWSVWRQTESSLAQRQAELAQAAKEEEYLRHIATELRQLKPVAGEEDTLSELRAKYAQGSKVTDSINDALSTLSGQKPVDAALRTALRSLSRAGTPESAAFSAAFDTLERVASDTEEAIALLEKAQQELCDDPLAIERAEERLFALRDAARKHRMTVGELPELLEQTERQLANLDQGAQDISALTKAAASAKAEFMRQAEAISRLRAKAAKTLEQSVAKELTPLRMGGTQLRVAVDPLPETQWGPRGIDAVRFEAATNKGNSFAPLARIASGGELSRFMLAMKVVFAEQNDGASLIFDEIDTGTGGAVADAIGQRLALLAQQRQVFVITHLPQVAARGQHHVRVWKEESKKATHTRTEILTPQSRQEELARMLAGAEVTAEARKAAAKLLEMAG